MKLEAKVAELEKQIRELRLQLNQIEELPRKNVVNLVSRLGVHYEPYSTTPYTGNWVEVYEGDGLLKSSYKNGLLDGPSERFYEDGQLKRRESYKNGERDGLWESFENGFLKSRERYKNGELDGLYESYGEAGVLEVRANYKNGLLDGLYESFVGFSQLAKINYKNDVPDGLYESFHKNGQLKSRANFKNGVLDGLLENFDEDGNTIEITESKDDSVEVTEPPDEIAPDIEPDETPEPLVDQLTAENVAAEIVCDDDRNASLAYTPSDIETSQRKINWWYVGTLFIVVFFLLKNFAP